MARLTKDQLMTARNANCATIDIPELGGEVGLRLMSLRESAEFSALSADMDGTESMQLYASYLIADEKGDRMFTADEVGELPAKILMAIVDEGNRINGVDDDEVEDAAKN